MPDVNSAQPPFLAGILVELRPAEHAGPPASKSVGSWWVWRTEDMKLVGHAGLSHVQGTVFSAGFFFLGRARAEGGYGAEVLRLLCRFAVDQHGATSVITAARAITHRATAEEAGFKLIESHPPQHAKRRRGYGWLKFAWEPKD